MVTIFLENGEAERHPLARTRRYRVCAAMLFLSLIGWVIVRNGHLLRMNSASA